MRRLLVILVIGAALTGCTDIHYLRKAEAAYIVQKRAYDARCVTIEAQKAPADCLEGYDTIAALHDQIHAYLSAYLEGPLPPAVRADLKTLPARIMATPTPTAGR